MRVAVLGGGGFRVPLLVGALAGRPELGVDEVRLYDVDPRRLGVIAAVLAGLVPDDAFAIRAASTVAAAVRDVDVVFCAIRVGGAAGRVRDERRALSAGVLGQETVGLAGLTYGLRTLPVALEHAEIIGRAAPAAWVVSFTNPAGMITEALRPVLGDRVIGICDSPAGLIDRACRALGVEVAAVTADYVGINHCGWLRALRRDGIDLLPALLASDRLLASIEEGRLFGPAVLRALGCIPNEYVHFYYAATDLTRRLAAGRTRAEVVAAGQQVFYDGAAAGDRVDPADPAGTPAAVRRWLDARRSRDRSYLAETRPPGAERTAADVAGGGYQEVAVQLITALRTGRPSTLILNVPNRITAENAGAAAGLALPSLPADMVVEVPCRVDGGGAHPLPADPLELHQLGLLASVRAAERAAIDAVRTGSRAAAHRALLIHPLCGSPAAADRVLSGLLADEPELAARLR